jgi:hypothetical protein
MNCRRISSGCIWEEKRTCIEDVSLAFIHLQHEKAANLVTEVVVRSPVPIDDRHFAFMRVTSLNPTDLTFDSEQVLINQRRPS